MTISAIEFRFGGLHAQSAEALVNGLTITEHKGWNEGVGTDYDEVRVPGEAGSFEVPVTLESRLAEFSGYGREDTFQKLEWLADSVTGQLGGSTTRPLIVSQFGRTLSAPAFCIRADFPVFGGQRFGDFKLGFWMPKPWKFGDPKDYAEGETAVHRGNGSAVPVFTVTGHRPSGYTIAGPEGMALTIDRPLLPGETHRYDMSSGELTVNGVLVDGGIARGDSWALGWGASWLHTISGGTGAFTTTITETRK